MGRKLILAVLLLLLTACGGAGASSTSSYDTAGGTTGAAASTAALAEAAGAPAPAAEASGVNIEGQQTQGAQNAQAPTARLVIRTATLRLLVDNVIEVEERVRQLAEAREGFVLSSQASGEDENRSATITFKVPAQRFDDAINELGTLARKIESQEVQGQDVTDEFVDLESRLRNLRAVETRLLELLRGASTTEAALQVNQELSNIQGQIEQAVGRINYLKQSAALSTITVMLRADPVVSIVPEATWSPVSTARAATNGLISFGQGLADLAIVFAVWSPVWLPVLLVALWLYRRSRRVPLPPAQPTQP